MIVFCDVYLKVRYGGSRWVRWLAFGCHGCLVVVVVVVVVVVDVGRGRRERSSGEVVGRGCRERSSGEVVGRGRRERSLGEVVGRGRCLALSDVSIREHTIYVCSTYHSYIKYQSS